MPNQLARLKEKLKKAAVVGGNVVIIERGVNRFRCQNSFHGKKEMVYLTFTPNKPGFPKMDEITCECGTVYRKEKVD